MPKSIKILACQNSLKWFEAFPCSIQRSKIPGRGWVLTHLEWPEEQVKFSGFNVHGEATDEQCPDLGTETTVVRARLDRNGGSFLR
jgi:hypothetical protein